MFYLLHMVDRSLPLFSFLSLNSLRIFYRSLFVSLSGHSSEVFYRLCFYSELDSFKVTFKNFCCLCGGLLLIPSYSHTDLLMILQDSDISSSALMVDSIGLNYLNIFKQKLIRHFLSCRQETAGVFLASFLFLQK